MESTDLRALEVQRKLGTEHFHANGHALPYNLLEFWQWCSSDLTNNAMRGVLAEYLVACDLGVTAGLRTEWDAYDLKTAEGVTVEVKSAAYLQSWHQTKLSAISFGVQPTLGWEASTNTSGTERKRQADVYVFAVLKHRDKRTVDPLDVEQWDFFVLPTTVLDERIGTQKQLSLATLLQLGPRQARFGELSATIKALFAQMAATNQGGAEQ